MTRIARTFETIKHPALITYVTGGDPDMDRSVSILSALSDSGSDIIEIGIPFTDPVADGETIQAANTRALNSGANLTKIIKMVREFRKTDSDTPIILMGYINPVMQYGIEQFMTDSKDAGIDGLIMVDLPPEESEELATLAAQNNIDFIRLITPTTDEARLKTILEGASGFLYYVSITGVTGAAKPDPAKIKTHLDMIRKHTNLPIAVGFGIKTPDDAKTMGTIANGVVVGSSIVQTVAEYKDSSDLCDKIGTQVSALSSALKSL